MYRKFIFTAIASLILVNTQAQSSFEDLKNDVVVTTDQKMTITLYRMITSNDVSVQYKYYAEAPAAGLMSRDYFVELFFEFYQASIYEFDAPEITPIDEIVGEADTEIKIFMGHPSLQYSRTENGKPTKNNFQWKDILSQEQIDDMKNDLVSITSDKWFMTKNIMATLVNGDQKQIQFSAETSSDGYISRDYFIAIASEYLQIYLEKLNIESEEDLSEIVGDSDINIKIHMSKVGLQIILNNEGVETKETHLWKNYFSN